MTRVSRLVCCVCGPRALGTGLRRSPAGYTIDAVRELASIDIMNRGAVEIMPHFCGRSIRVSQWLRDYGCFVLQVR